MTTASRPLEGTVPRSAPARAASGIKNLLAMVSPAGPCVLRAAATLRLADHVADGATELAALAQAAGVNIDALERLMRFLTARGIFVESSAGEFRLNAAARLLRDEHVSKLRSWLDLHGAGARMDAVWPQLLHTLRTGEPAYSKVYGREFWDDLAADSALAESFEVLMAANASWTARDVVGGHDWSAASDILDVGGGNGELLASILSNNPDLRGSVLELPETSPCAEEYLSRQPIDGRWSVLEGSFFEPFPVHADVYILANVLHDWNDSLATSILKRAAEAAKVRGHVLIIERIRDTATLDDTTEEDLRYLLVFGGRTRTVAELQRLAAAVGLSIASCSVTPSGVALLEAKLSSHFDVRESHE